MHFSGKTLCLNSPKCKKKLGGCWNWWEGGEGVCWLWQFCWLWQYPNFVQNGLPNKSITYYEITILKSESIQDKDLLSANKPIPVHGNLNELRNRQSVEEVLTKLSFGVQMFQSLTGGSCQLNWCPGQICVCPSCPAALCWSHHLHSSSSSTFIQTFSAISALTGQSSLFVRFLRKK